MSCPHCGLVCRGPCYDHCPCWHCWQGWDRLSLWQLIRNRVRYLIYGED